MHVLSGWPSIDVKEFDIETMDSKLEWFSQGFTDTCFPLILLVSVTSITLVITVFEEIYVAY